MTTKINLAPFQIRTRKGYIWIENTETGGPLFLPCQEKYAPKKLTKSRGYGGGPVWVSRPKSLKLKDNSLHFFLDLCICIPYSLTMTNTRKHNDD